MELEKKKNGAPLSYHASEARVVVVAARVPHDASPV